MLIFNFSLFVVTFVLFISKLQLNVNNKYTTPNHLPNQYFNHSNLESIEWNIEMYNNNCCHTAHNNITILITAYSWLYRVSNIKFYYRICFLRFCLKYFEYSMARLFFFLSLFLSLHWMPFRSEYLRKYSLQCRSICKLRFRSVLSIHLL